MQDSIKVYWTDLYLSDTNFFPCVKIREIVNFLIAIFCLLSPFSITAEVTLQWDPITEPNLAGSENYDGISSRNYQLSFDVGQTTYTNINFFQDDTTYYFAVIACDT